MKKELQTLIENKLQILKDRIKDTVTYEHIIASVLEIHTKHLRYNKVIDQLTQELSNIEEDQNKEVYWSIYFLSQIVAGCHREMQNMYTEEISEDREEWQTNITGAVCEFIDTNS